MHALRVCPLLSILFLQIGLFLLPKLLVDFGSSTWFIAMGSCLYDDEKSISPPMLIWLRLLTGRVASWSNLCFSMLLFESELSSFDLLASLFAMVRLSFESLLS